MLMEKCDVKSNNFILHKEKREIITQFVSRETPRKTETRTE